MSSNTLKKLSCRIPVTLSVMIKSLNSILVAGVVAAAMLSSGHTLASPQTIKTATASPAPASTAIYRFATVIKTQALRAEAYNSAAAISEAKIDTQLIYSPAYPSIETCNIARNEISKLLGADVAIKSSASTASVKYQSSDCMVSAGP